MDYNEFLEAKATFAAASGIDIDSDDLNTGLFDWQKVLVKWSLRKGKSALFEDCGLGKTIQQLDRDWEARKRACMSKATFEPGIID